MNRWPALGSHGEFIVAIGASMTVVLVAAATAAFLVLRRRASDGQGSEHTSGLAWRHHVGCSLADTESTSSTIFLASDLCISIKHGDESTQGDPQPTIEPAAAGQLTAAGSPAVEPVATSEWSDPEDAARWEILLLERLWEISPDPQDDPL